MAIVAEGLTKSYGTTIVLDQISLTINDGNHVAVVGPNGSGKSTLLRILAGVEATDSGTVTCRSPSEILGYLPQTVSVLHNESLADWIADAVGQLRQMELRMRELESKMASADPQTIEVLLEEYGQVTASFEDHGGYEIDRRINEVLSGLELGQIPKEQSVITLSGGERSRCALAALLIKDPDLLLLDEPTNHLDLYALEWLESYLAAKQRTIVVVSHDRAFINRFATSIFDLDEYSHSIRSYGGNYDFYVVAKAKERESWLASYERQQEEIMELRHKLRTSARQVGHGRAARDSDKMAYDARGGRVQASISSNVRMIEERLRRIERNPIPKPPDPLRVDPRIQGTPLKSVIPIRAEQVSVTFGERRILDAIHFQIEKDSRIAIVGPNGAGKTTLLRLLAGAAVPDEGLVQISQEVRIGYLTQEAATFNPEKTVLEAYREDLIGTEDELVAEMLRYGLLRSDDLRKKVRQLSVGQRRKLEIARMIARRPNVLLVDEPTNHLGLDVLAAFEDALREFSGPVVAVSHDRWFIQRFEGQIFMLNGGRLKEIEEYPPKIA